MSKITFYIKLLWTQFWYILLYRDRSRAVVTFKNCTFMAKMGDSKEASLGLYKIFIKTLKEKNVSCVINGEPATVTYTFYGTLKFYSNQEVDKDHPYFNLDVKA